MIGQRVAGGFAAPLQRQRFAFLDYLRAAAAWAVVWDHVIAQWGAGAGLNFRPLSFVQAFITQPLGIIQDFGWLAVCLFFLISGFVITHVAMRESLAEFLVKRVFRIFPMLILFVSLSLMLLPAAPRVGVWDFIEDATLLAWFNPSSVHTVGVAWTLAIEVLFYILTAATMWTRRPLLMVSVNLSAVLSCVYTCQWFGNRYFLLAVNMAYVPYLILGQVFYLGLASKQIRPFATSILVMACYGATLYGLERIHRPFLPLDNSYLVNAIYAIGGFLAMLASNAYLRPGKFIRYLSATSFTVYLTHSVLGLAVFVRLLEPLGVHLAIVGALLATALGSAVIHECIEKPSMAVGRRLAALLRRSLPTSVVRAQAIKS